MARNENFHFVFFVTDLAINSVVAHSIAPHPLSFTVQCLPKLAWILSFLNTLIEEAKDSGLNLPVKSGDLFLCRAGKVNAPGQGGAPTLPG